MKKIITILSLVVLSSCEMNDKGDAEGNQYKLVVDIRYKNPGGRDTIIVHSSKQDGGLHLNGYDDLVQGNDFKLAIDVRTFSIISIDSIHE
jgi:hypothetical protein